MWRKELIWHQGESAMASNIPANALFGRSWQLLLTSQSNALDLSNLRFKFTTEANDVETPNTAIIRVYNAKEATIKLAVQEYYGVIINAGYQGNVGTIFQGTIKQFVRGKERNTDSFLEIRAADSDLAYNFGIINKTLPAGSTNVQHLQNLVDALSQAQSSIQQSAQAQQITLDPNAISFLSSTGGILPRGKVLFGMARDYLRDLADTNNCRWSIQKGVLTLIPLTGYLPGQAVQINSATGMLGMPEATDQGVKVKCLLNSKIRVGGLIQLNNQDITQTTIKEQFFPGYTDFNLIATVPSTAKGFYRVVVIEYQGDTRGDEWYANLTCVSVNQSVPADESVLPYGIPLNSE
jgi:hypothetical protein